MAKRNAVVSETDLLGACTCVACRNLLEECGALVFAFYRARLLVKGWAGPRTPAEKAYQKVHAKGWARATDPVGGTPFGKAPRSRASGE